MRSKQQPDGKRALRVEITEDTSRRIHARACLDGVTLGEAVESTLAREDSNQRKLRDSGSTIDRSASTNYRTLFERLDSARVNQRKSWQQFTSQA